MFSDWVWHLQRTGTST